MQVAIVLSLLHANIGRYVYILVTEVFHKGVNSISADESSPLVPTRCLLSLVSNGNLILLFLYGSKFNRPFSTGRFVAPFQTM